MNDTVRYVKKEVGESIWSTENVETGANDKYDGMKNMAVIKKISGWKNLYPAFALCDALNTSGVTGWYLPAYYELSNRIRPANGTYWSSSESSNKYAGYYSPSETNAARKTDTKLKVMAVHKF